MRKCAACGDELPAITGRGRPRKFCTACTPPGTSAAAGRAWRAVNPARVALHNIERAKRPETRRRWRDRVDKLTRAA
jgi:hypothetical protein